MTDYDFSKTAFIMYPTSWPEQAADSHCTIIFLTPDIYDVDYSVQDVKSVLDSFLWPKEILAATNGIEFFGPEEDIPVVRLLGENLQNNHDTLLAALDANGIHIEETWPVYKPHVTVNPFDVLPKDFHSQYATGLTTEGRKLLLWNYAEIPDLIGLQRPEIWWGNEHY